LQNQRLDKRKEFQMKVESQVLPIIHFLKLTGMGFGKMKKMLAPTNGSDHGDELRRENAKREQLEELLEESGIDLNEIMGVSPVPQFVINKDHNVIYWNRALEKLSKIKADQILGTNKQWKVFYDNERPCMADFIVDGHLEEIPKWYTTKNNRSKFMLRYHGKSESETLGDSCEAVAFFPLMSDKGKWLHFTVDAIKNPKGNVIGAVETFEDVTKQIHLQEEFVKTTEEKEVLLKKIQHRVKSDLQTIDSMIHYQSYYITDDESMERFKEIQNPVKSMIQIHRKLYQSKDLANIDFGVFIRSLILDRFRAYEIDKNTIQVDIDINNILLDINTAIPCGIIANELVSDSIKRSLLTAKLEESKEGKHKNPYKMKDEFSMKITDKGEFYSMTVYDNVKVSPENFGLQNNTLDMWFINKLITQLRGTVNLEQENGTLFKITFKKIKI